MKDIRALLLLGVMGFTPAAMSQNIFTGTWRPDPQVFSPTRRPDVIELANSIYECRSCSPPYKIKADGHEQTIEGDPNYDALSMTVVDDRTVTKIAKKHGKVVLEAKVLVSVDGMTKTDVQTIYDMAPRPIEFTTHSTRVSAGRKGSQEESDKKDGKMVKISLWSVGPDGKTMHVRFDDMHGHVQEQDGHKVE